MRYKRGCGKIETLFFSSPQKIRKTSSNLVQREKIVSIFGQSLLPSIQMMTNNNYPKRIVLGLLFAAILSVMPSSTLGQTATVTSGTSQLGFGLRVGMSNLSDYNFLSVIGAQFEYIDRWGFEVNDRGVGFGLIRWELGIERWAATPDEIYSLAATMKWYPPIRAPRLKPYLGLGGGGFNIHIDGDKPTGILPSGHVAAGLEYRGGWDSKENKESTWFLQMRAGFISSGRGAYVIILNGFNWYSFPFFG